MSSRRIRAVRAARMRAASPTMVVHALCSDSEDGGGLTIVANRAIGGAVVRNRAKRRLRAAARRARLPAGADLVVDARSDAVRAPFTTLHRDLERLTTRAAERARR
ncbi:MAG TPA: ribonuclease P protein component [Euzebyales bacterium]|nr:ribonuclease P protein component [Euzebyales bacterium]